MKHQRKPLLICIAIPLLVGGLAAVLTGGFAHRYAQMVKPPFSPPGWVFPAVWPVLYLLMGFASFLVLTDEENIISNVRALILYGLQLIANFLWPILFFYSGFYLSAFFWVVLLWLLAFWTARAFAGIRELAGDLLLPYLIWITYAGYLNLSIFILN